MNQFRKFAYVMGANFETVMWIVAAHFGANWLNENYPKSFDWSNVTYLFALLLICRSWYVIIRMLIRDQRKLDKEDPKP